MNNFETLKIPKLSVIIPSYNGGRFVRSTINSILKQTSDEFEVIVVDGASTDDTLKNLAAYPTIKLVSEPDRGYVDAFMKGFKMARGKYIMQCCISDGFLDKEWIGECIKVLDSDKSVSLVWGLQQQMDNEGNLGEILYPQFYHLDPPQKENFFYYWLAASTEGFVLPEPNYVIRKNVLEECLPKLDAKTDRFTDMFMEVSYKFFKNGYSPYFLRRVANYARLHDGNVTLTMANNGAGKRVIQDYKMKCATYRKSLLLNPEKHIFRDGDGNPTGVVFSRKRFILNNFINPLEIFKRGLAFPKPYIRAVLNFLITKRIIPKELIEYLKKKFTWLRAFCGAYW